MSVFSVFDPKVRLSSPIGASLEHMHLLTVDNNAQLVGFELIFQPIGHRQALVVGHPNNLRPLHGNLHQIHRAIELVGIGRLNVIGAL